MDVTKPEEMKEVSEVDLDEAFVREIAQDIEQSQQKEEKNDNFWFWVYTLTLFTVVLILIFVLYRKL